MSEMEVFLEEIHIENYRSLHNVRFPLKRLTILVGPNASGKSNVLRALGLLSGMANHDELPSTQFIQDDLWAGAVKGSNMVFELHTTAEKTKSVYQLGLKADGDSSYAKEELLVNDVEVISTQDGKGIVRDESNENPIKYNSEKLVLNSVGAYGEKPFTNALVGFIKVWEFYNIQPEMIRSSFFSKRWAEMEGLSQLDSAGMNLYNVLSNWHNADRELFLNVSEGLATSTGINIDCHTVDGKNQVGLLEGYEKPIPLEKASDGTLRLAAYYTLLNQPELPPLISIEEPERHLHPGILSEMAKILQKIAAESQVIVTTHSPEFLDCFSAEDLSDELGVLLLNKHPETGTEIFNLEDIRGDQIALDGWIKDFGVGSAIFDSGLINPTEEESVCQS